MKQLVGFISKGGYMGLVNELKCQMCSQACSMTFLATMSVESVGEDEVRRVYRMAKDFCIPCLRKLLLASPGDKK